MARGPQDITFRKYAREILNRDKESIVSVAMRVFGVKEDWAKKMAWEWQKNPTYIQEYDRLLELRQSDQPATKEAKLLNNKILMDEAFADRDMENYIKLSRMDNEMQGHNKSQETEDEKVKGGNALIGELITQLRNKNRDSLPSANQEIVNI